MSFNTSISGLNAAQKDLNVTSNNIANAKSTGFKKSRAEFGDIYAVSAFGNSNTAVGQGVINQAVSQQFTQGNLDFTDRSLDLAISGEGFFAFQPSLDSQQAVYSRAGALGVNKDGYVVNQAGEFLKTLPVNENGDLQSASLALSEPLQLPATAGAPEATTEAAMTVELPPNAEVLSSAPAFDPNNPETYNDANSQRIYDSLGNPHTLTTYFRKTGVDDTAKTQTWEAYHQVNGIEVAPSYPSQTLVFNGSGELASLTDGSGNPLSNPDPSPQTVTADSADLGTGSDDLSIEFNFGVGTNAYGATGGSLVVADQSQNGMATGRLTGISVGSDGLIRANYTNGQNTALGMVALVDFRNPQALKQVGNNQWEETIDSGEPLAGEPGTGTYGAIQGGALEASNVDLTSELVNLITAQRNFQANSRAIEANKTLSDTIIGIR